MRDGAVSGRHSEGRARGARLSRSRFTPDPGRGAPACPAGPGLVKGPCAFLVSPPEPASTPSSPTLTAGWRSGPPTLAMPVHGTTRKRLPGPTAARRLAWVSRARRPLLHPRTPATSVTQFRAWCEAWGWTWHGGGRLGDTWLRPGAAEGVRLLQSGGRTGRPLVIHTPHARVHTHACTHGRAAFRRVLGVLVLRGRRSRRL